MASGSQTCSGNWALLPAQPAKIPRPARVNIQNGICRGWPVASSILTLWVSGSTSWTTSAPLGRVTSMQISRRTAQALVDFLKAERAQAGPEQAQPHQHADVADPVDDERLVGRVAVDLLLVPEADQQVRADADQLPEHEDHEDVARGDQAEHREAKERQIGEKSRITRVVVHVAHRVDVDQGRDERDHEEHHRAQVVDGDAQGNRQAGRRIGGRLPESPSRHCRTRPAACGELRRAPLRHARRRRHVPPSLAAGSACVRIEVALDRVIEETDQGEQAGKADRPGGQVGVITASTAG